MSGTSLVGPCGYTRWMRRVAHFIAPLVIVVTTFGGSVSLRSVSRLLARLDSHGAVEAVAAPAGAVATHTSGRRVVTAAAAFDRASSRYFAASSSVGATLRPIGRVDAPLSIVARHAFDPDAARDRAPPSSR